MVNVKKAIEQLKSDRVEDRLEALVVLSDVRTFREVLPQARKEAAVCGSSS